MLPNFIGIGAPKCGTTWLFKLLSQHPEIFIPSAKELQFFADYNLNASIEEYESYFEEVNLNKYKAIGEISTNYLDSVYAPARAKEKIPGVKIFVCFRNPVDQVYSMYWHSLRQNFHVWQNKRIPSSFEEAIQTYERSLLKPALYYTNIQHWLDYFDASQLKIIFFDDIIDNPRSVAAELFKFLDVNNDFFPGDVQNNSSTREGVSPKSKVYSEIYKSVYGFANKRIYVPMKKMLGMKNATAIKDNLRVRLIFEKIFFKKGYPPMKPETREYLKEYYRDEVTKLQSLTGRNLTHWL